MIWLIGSKGMLGSEIAKQLTENKISWIGTDMDVDITDPVALEKFTMKHGSSSGRTKRRGPPDSRCHTSSGSR